MPSLVVIVRVTLVMGMVPVAARLARVVVFVPMIVIMPVCVHMLAIVVMPV
jgi:hypothetical protein